MTSSTYICAFLLHLLSSPVKTMEKLPHQNDFHYFLQYEEHFGTRDPELN